MSYDDDVHFVQLSSMCINCDDFIVRNIDGYIVMPFNFLQKNPKQIGCIIDTLKTIAETYGYTLVIARIEEVLLIMDYIKEFKVEKKNGLYYAFFPSNHIRKIKSYMRDLL